MRSFPVHGPISALKTSSALVQKRYFPTSMRIQMSVRIKNYKDFPDPFASARMQSQSHCLNLASTTSLI